MRPVTSSVGRIRSETVFSTGSPKIRICRSVMLVRSLSSWVNEVDSRQAGETLDCCRSGALANGQAVRDECGQFAG